MYNDYNNIHLDDFSDKGGSHMKITFIGSEEQNPGHFPLQEYPYSRSNPAPVPYRNLPGISFLLLPDNNSFRLLHVFTVAQQKLPRVRTSGEFLFHFGEAA